MYHYIYIYIYLYIYIFIYIYIYLYIYKFIYIYKYIHLHIPAIDGSSLWISGVRITLYSIGACSPCMPPRHLGEKKRVRKGGGERYFEGKGILMQIYQRNLDILRIYIYIKIRLCRVCTLHFIYIYIYIYIYIHKNTIM